MAQTSQVKTSVPVVTVRVAEDVVAASSTISPLSAGLSVGLGSGLA